MIATTMRTSCALFTLLPSVALAFKVDFFTDKKCVAPDQITNSIEKNVCYKDFKKGNEVVPLEPSKGQLYNVVIGHDFGDTLESGVAFYGRENCDRIIAFSNVPTCLGAGNYATYQALELDDAEKDLKKLLQVDPTVLVAAVPPQGTVAIDADDAAKIRIPGAKDGAQKEKIKRQDDGEPKRAGRRSLQRRSDGTDVIPVHTFTEEELKKLDGRSESESLHRRSDGTDVVPVHTFTEDELKKLDGRSEPEPLHPVHGEKTVRGLNGVEHTWQQIGARAFRGIPSHQWDPNLHKRNADPIPHLDAAFPAGRPLVQRRDAPQQPHHPHQRRDSSSSPNPASLLTPRLFKEGRCELIRTCLIANPESAFLPIHLIADEFIKAIQHFSTTGKDWDFLAQPFAIEFTEPVDPAHPLPADTPPKTAGFAMAQTLLNVPDSETLGECTDNAGGQRGSLYDVLFAGIEGAEITDLRVDVRVGGEEGTGRGALTNSLFVSTRSAGNKGKAIAFRPICQITSVQF